MKHEKNEGYIHELFERVDEENKKSVKWFAHDIAQKVEIGGKKV